MDWKVYYSDQSVESSRQSTPETMTRRRGVQVIIQEDPDHGWVTVPPRDFYIWDDRGRGPKWFGVDIFGLHDYLLDPGPKFVLFGTIIDKYAYWKISELAHQDPDFRPKSGYSRDEVKAQDPELIRD